MALLVIRSPKDLNRLSKFAMEIAQSSRGRDDLALGQNEDSCSASCSQFGPTGLRIVDVRVCLPMLRTLSPTISIVFLIWVRLDSTGISTWVVKVVYSFILLR